MAHIINSDGTPDDTTKASKDFTETQAARPPEGNAGNVRHTSRTRGEPTNQAGVNDSPQHPGLGMGEQPSNLPNVAATDPRLTPGNMANPIDVAGQGIRHFTMSPASWHQFARNVEEQAKKLQPKNSDGPIDPKNKNRS